MHLTFTARAIADILVCHGYAVCLDAPYAVGEARGKLEGAHLELKGSERGAGLAHSLSQDVTSMAPLPDGSNQV